MLATVLDAGEEGASKASTVLAQQHKQTGWLDTVAGRHECDGENRTGESCTEARKLERQSEGQGHKTHK